METMKEEMAEVSAPEACSPVELKKLPMNKLAEAAKSSDSLLYLNKKLLQLAEQKVSFSEHSVNIQ
jgi:hypothetical protein